MGRMKYFHVDVFSPAVLSGNGLAVVFPEEELGSSQMLAIAGEFKQFESIFVYPADGNEYPVRIFTVDEELGFAGHPMLGAAAVLHKTVYSKDDKAFLRLKTPEKIVDLISEKTDDCFTVEMNQGRPEFIKSFDSKDIDVIKDILSAMDLSKEQLFPGYPIEVVSTGLPYLLLPVTPAGLQRTGLFSDGFDDLINSIGAAFVYLFEPETLECRTWDNKGLIEDVATGSAAGPLCAYLVKNGFAPEGKAIKISQGAYAGRPGIIEARQSENTGEIFISGSVSFFAEGILNIQSIE